MSNFDSLKPVPPSTHSPRLTQGHSGGDVIPSLEYQETVTSTSTTHPVSTFDFAPHSGSSQAKAGLDDASSSAAGCSADAAGPSSAPQHLPAPSDKGKPTRRRIRLPDKESLICLICTDKASGRNFGALSCESCKAFFRRNGQKESITSCVFDSNCEINPHTRKFCTECRLRKCLSAGMTSELILDDATKSKRKKCPKRKKDATNTQVQDAPDSTESHEVAGTSSTFYVPITPEEKAEIDLIINNHAVIDTALSPKDQMAMFETLPQEMQQQMQTLINDDNPSFLTPEQVSIRDQIRTMMSGNTTAVISDLNASNSNFADTAEALKQENEEIKDNSKYGEERVEMKRPELANLTYLKTMSKERDYLINHDEYEMLRKPPESNAGVFNMADGFIRRLVKFVRTIDRFRNLGVPGQTTLLREGMMDLMAIRSAIQYNPAVDGFTLTDKEHGNTDSISMDFIKKHLGEEIYEKHMQFVNGLNHAACWDKPTMVLAMLINLFSSDRPHLDVDKKDEVERSAIHYTELLLKYLQSLHSSSKAKAVHWRTLGALTNVRDYGHDSQAILQGINPERLGPLLREIFTDSLASQQSAETLPTQLRVDT